MLNINYTINVNNVKILINNFYTKKLYSYSQKTLTTVLQKLHTSQKIQKA